MQSAGGATVCTSQRRQTVSKPITSFVGLDVHIDSIAMGVAAAMGREEPHFVGTVARSGARGGMPER